MDIALAAPPETPRLAPRTRLARLIAFYLPQFHPIPENDSWWGLNFTEWTNVRHARPLFRGHLQPRIPGHLGYYDLRDPEIRQAQAALAAAAGIEAFCYWHYWFGGGRRILQRPFDEVLRTGRPDFPFCLCWANESWTGIWHGAPDRVLIEQTYPGPADQARHFALLLPAFRDPRYLTVEGKPLFLVYRPENLPDAAQFTAHWRHLAAQSGLPGLYLVGMGNSLAAACLTPFDAILPYGPRDFLDEVNQHRLVLRAGRRFLSGPMAAAFSDLFPFPLPWLPARYRYAALARSAFAELPASPKYLPCVLAGWDNTPRAGRAGIVLEDFSPALFRACLDKALAHVAPNPPAQKLVFIKSWNEWADGNYVEPDQHFGSALLNTVADAVLPTS
jgi:hypothetical protein